MVWVANTDLFEHVALLTVTNQYAATLAKISILTFHLT